MLEFDIVMKSRGFSHGQRMLQHALLAKDYPDSTVKVRPVSPTVLYLSARIEGEEGTDYFDAGVAVQISRGFQKIPNMAPVRPKKSAPARGQNHPGSGMVARWIRTGRWIWVT